MQNMMVKTRTFTEHNYHSVYHNGKTIRIALDPKKPIGELDFPEFYDVKITNYCRGGCKYCYQNSTPEEEMECDILNKFVGYFQNMSDNEKPFQIAFGGGEPTEHPQFHDIIKECYHLGITPNYTTNGMNVTPEILDTAHKYCGGVAITAHKHLEGTWRGAVQDYINNDIVVNIHHIISDKESVDELIEMLGSKEFEKVEYFVLLPYMKMGRAEEELKIEADYLFDKLPKDQLKRIAFGANFYPHLQGTDMDVSLYEPEIMSKYLDLTNMKVYKSSFNLNDE